MKVCNIGRAENLMRLRKHYKEMQAQAKKHKNITSISMNVSPFGTVFKAQSTNMDITPIVEAILTTISNNIKSTEAELKSIGIDL